MNIMRRFYNLLINQNGQSEELATLVTEDVRWHVSAPIDDLQGLEQITNQFWQPIASSLSNIEYKPFIQLQGESNGKPWVASTGYFVGNFSAPLLGIPATHRSLYLRFTELTELTEAGDKIACNYIILDMLDAMDQAGVNPLRPSLGKVGVFLPPSTMDGLTPLGSGSEQGSDSEQGATSMLLVKDMLAELGRFDGKSLTSMKLEDYWHPDFMWYGPAGIGTTRGITDFRQQHQGPFVFSFPDRVVDHCATFIAQGNYAATGGWPHMHGTHTHGGWLGLPPSNQYLSLRVMDIWRREGNLLRENWVAIDIVDMCRQMGLDVFSMMRASRSGNGLNA